ncbi:MAG TPA: permease [Nitrospirae bacterium]|nr:hypothetical protein BMS3Abin06_02520 [bacterium BMS3Abin06]HDH11331.1 permease [Nitrospirota bacterium]HDZ02656.1 permease [Nitrospirota bacterium]
MSGKQKSAVSIFNTHTDAEDAVRELQKSGFDMKKLSIAGKDYHSGDSVAGYYNTGDGVKYRGKSGVFWEGVWETVLGSAFFIIPGIGPVVFGGPLVKWIISALEGATLVDGLNAIGTVFYSIGIPNDSILEYETSLKSNKLLLVANGIAEEVEQARKILEATKATDTTVHHG